LATERLGNGRLEMHACSALCKIVQVGIRAGALVLICLAVAACKSIGNCPPGDHLRLTDILQLRHEMSVQFMRLATDRDAVSDGLGSVVAYCNPESSDPVYKRVLRQLDQLISHLHNDPSGAQAANRLKIIRNKWLEISRTHHEIWVESEGVEGMRPEDRCVRMSRIVSRVLSVESGFDAIVKGAALP
jgi:hypothetical protein